MSLRDEFEKLCPVPEGVEWRPDGYYAGGLTGMCYQEKYQGFLLGRRNTVSVEKYQEVWNAYVEAKRRTEEV